MKNLMKTLIGTLAAALLAIPMTASALMFQVQITGTGDFAGVYDSGVVSTDWIAGALPSSSFAFDISVNNSPGGIGGAASFLDSTWGAYAGSQGGTVTILASATDYTFPTAGSIANILSSIGGTTSNATVTSAQAWVDNSNTLNGMGGASTSQGPLSASSFSGDAMSSAFSVANPFSITQRIVLTIAARGNTTGDF
jgi:hypothetical protein